MTIQTIQKLRQRLEKRIEHLKLASYDSFQESLLQFWEFFNSEQILFEIRKHLLDKFPNTVEKVNYIFLNPSNRKEISNPEENIAIACEILSSLSYRSDVGNFRLSLQASVSPVIYGMHNCKSQQEVDENYLKVFKSRYLDKFYFYLEDKIEEIEMTNEKNDDFNKQQNSTYNQNFYAPVGTASAGNNNVINVNQNIGQNFSEILEQLAILKARYQSVSIEDKEEAIDTINDFEKEIVKENPNRSKIRGFLISTKEFAVKTGTELAASTLAKLLESQMGIKS